MSRHHAKPTSGVELHRDRESILRRVRSLRRIGFDDDQFNPDCAIDCFRRGLTPAVYLRCGESLRRLELPA